MKGVITAGVLLLILWEANGNAIGNLTANNEEISNSSLAEHHVPSALDETHVQGHNGSALNTTEAGHNGTETKVVENDLKHPKPCPLPRMENVSHQGNGSDIKNGSLVKDEKHETALEQISDSIAGVVSTIKKSFTSIFSPGSGLGRTEEDCLNATASTNNTSNVTSLDPVKDQDLHHVKETVLIHPVSNNDSVNSSLGEGNSTKTTEGITTTALPVSDMSTSTPAPA